MSLHIDDLRRLCDDGEAGPVANDEVEEKTEVDADEDDEGDMGERVRMVGVSVSFRRSGSKGESTGDE
jgi:hypothetical protein